MRSAITQAGTARLVEKNRLSADDRDATLARITTTRDLGLAAEADIVADAIFEQVEVKQEPFPELDWICRADTVLATNTSAIPSTPSPRERPARVGRRHAFLPRFP